MIFVQPILQFFGANGVPMAGATLYFYEQGTTDPVEVFSDPAMAMSAGTSVVADDNGLMPAIYYDRSVPVRVKLVEADGDVDNPFADVGLASLQLDISASDLTADILNEVFGFTVQDPAATNFTAPATMDFDEDEAALDPLDVGFRGSPVVAISANTTLDLKHSGKLFVKSAAAATPAILVPNDADLAWPIGHSFEVYNMETGSMSITTGTAVVMRKLGASTDNATLTLTAWGKIKVTKVAENTWVAEGTGI